MNPRAFKYKHKDTGSIYWREDGVIKFKANSIAMDHFSLLDLSDFRYLIKIGLLVKIK